MVYKLLLVLLLGATYATQRIYLVSIPGTSYTVKMTALVASFVATVVVSGPREATPGIGLRIAVSHTHLCSIDTRGGSDSANILLHEHDLGSSNVVILSI